ncbi:MAG TPA: hypothetical protein VFQ61_16910 [Polyangiaceae bacterium]|nr:hypothetical protein [Polyangiaceae bacterium]
MPALNSGELKKALRASGFEIYRASPSEVRLAERVRENLLMDSGVAVRLAEPLSVAVYVRAEGSKFSGEAAEQLYARARERAEALRVRGFEEHESRAVPIWDPGDRTQLLDTWYEVCFVKPVEASELDQTLRDALSFEKTA